MATLKPFAGTLFFLLELATYAVAVWWGFATFAAWPLKLLAGLGAPALLIAVWVRFGAPTATWHLTGFARAALLAVWFGSAVAGLIALGRWRWALAFAVAAVLVSAADLAWSRPA
ncbi:MAG TPA: YrdB family protein [Phytomonospora sp.]